MVTCIIIIIILNFQEAVKKAAENSDAAQCFSFVEAYNGK